MVLRFNPITGKLDFYEAGASLFGDPITIAHGGTGLVSYTIGDLLYASGATTLSKLADVATGQVLKSGGVGVAPAYGAVDLTTDVTGTLPLGNGGTGATSFTAGSIIFSNGTVQAQDNANFFWDDANNRLGIGTATPAQALSIAAGGSIYLSGGSGSSQNNIRFGGTPASGYDANMLYLDSSAKTLGLVAGTSPIFTTANGPFMFLRGNTFTAQTNQRGFCGFAAGYITSAPVGNDGCLVFYTGNTQERYRINSYGDISFTQGIAAAATSPQAFSMVTAAHTAMAATVEASSVAWNFGATKTWAAGNILLQREFRINPAVLSISGGASTVTLGMTLEVDGGPTAAAGTTLTTSMAMGIGPWAANSASAHCLGIVVSSIAEGFGTMTEITGTTIQQAPTNDLGNQTATLTKLSLYNADPITFTASGGATRTVTIASAMRLNVPIAGSGVVFGNSYGLFVETGITRLDGAVCVGGLTVPTGTVHITPSTAATIGYKVTGAGSQTANFFHAENSANAELFSVRVPSASTRGAKIVSRATGGTTASFEAHEPANGYPRAQFIVGDTAISNAAISLTPSINARTMFVDIATYSDPDNASSYRTIIMSNTSGYGAIYTGRGANADGAKLYFGTTQIGSNGSLVIDTNANGQQILVNSARIQEAQGTDVASANDLTLGAGGNAFAITGTTTINAITSTNWQNGSLITLVFADALTVKHNTAGTGATKRMLLNGGIDFPATASDTLTLRLMVVGGTQYWFEIARAVI